MKTTKTKAKPKLLSWWKEKCWKLFSEYVRRKHCDEDGYGHCFTCNVAMHWKQLQAGHCIPSRSNAVLLDEEIVRPQCVTCNVFKHGMHHVFTTKLIAEFGMEWWLRKLAESNRSVKVSRVNYEEKIAELKCKIANLP